MSMAGLPLECILMSAYALSLTLIALFLEWVAGHAHRRSLRVSTTGFTYHADRDIGSYPKDQHLFPVFSDSVKGNVIYRAPASACNACPSKAACTDSNHGRQIERNLTDLEYGMKRFHRAVSLTLLALASLILVVELFRTAGLYPRIMLLVSLALLIMFIRRVAGGLIPSVIQA
jgi:hypothetical protein